jgi:hypothetical protein
MYIIFTLYDFLGGGVRGVHPVTNSSIFLTFFVFTSRHHRHDGCTKTTDKVKTVLKRAGLKECSTDYQSSYQSPPCNFVRKIRRPLPRLRNPNPPPMDFRTITNTEYVQHDEFKGPPKPVKVNSDPEVND